MRPAPSAWEKDYADKLTCEGSCRGKTASTAFFQLASERLCGVMTLLSSGEVETKMREWYSVKVRRIMGPDPGDCKKITMLGRELV